MDLTGMAEEETTGTPKTLETQAEEFARQGNFLDLQGCPEQAEQKYLRALKIWEELLTETGAPVYAHGAREICEHLADLLMQQGNMHGADLYYVKAFSYGSGLSR